MLKLMGRFRWVVILLVALGLWVIFYDLAVLGCRFTVWMGTDAKLFPGGW